MMGSVIGPRTVVPTELAHVLTACADLRGQRMKRASRPSIVLARANGLQCARLSAHGFYRYRLRRVAAFQQTGRATRDLA